MSEKRRFYTWRKCSTCRDAKESLGNLGLTVEERDFFAEPLSRAELKELVSAAGIENLFSWRSPSSKPYRARRQSISQDELIDAMLDEPRLIRRPIVVRPGDQPIVGFNAQAYAALTD